MELSLGRQRLAFALDCPEWESALNVAKQVAPHVGVLKVGLELFVREGPRAVRLGRDLGCDTFLDLKLHDIPETVERAVANICQLGVQYLTVHASGGPRMLSQAVERVAKEGVPLTLLAVTLLTSLDASDLEAIGIHRNPEDQVLSLARMAHAVGVPGYICSTSDVARLRSVLGSAVMLVTPGIRPSGPAGDDQKRVGTPAFAIRAGSSLLVVGRPIRDAKDPRTAAAEIELEITQALSA
jgi:orotidine-5'-phosphate decarboxylase